MFIPWFLTLPTTVLLLALSIFFMILNNSIRSPHNLLCSKLNLSCPATELKSPNLGIILTSQHAWSLFVISKMAPRTGHNICGRISIFRKLIIKCPVFPQPRKSCSLLSTFSARYASFNELDMHKPDLHFICHPSMRTPLYQLLPYSESQLHLLQRPRQSLIFPAEE